VAVTIKVRRIVEVHAEVERAIEGFQRNCIVDLAIGRRTSGYAADTPASKADFRDEQAGPAERTILHVGVSMCRLVVAGVFNLDGTIAVEIGALLVAVPHHLTAPFVEIRPGFRRPLYGVIDVLLLELDRFADQHAAIEAQQIAAAGDGDVLMDTRLLDQ